MTADPDAAERRRLGEWLLPRQQRWLTALQPDRTRWPGLLGDNPEISGPIQSALGMDAAARAARQVGLDQARQQRLTALEPPAILSLLLWKLDAVIAAHKANGGRPPRRPPLLGTTMQGAVNGAAWDVGSPRYVLIEFPVGITAFCNLAAKSVAHVFPRIEKERGFAFDFRPDAVAASLAADRGPALRFAEMVRAWLIDGRPDFARRWLPDPSHMPLHGSWLSAMELFVVAHEYGHVVAGHLDAPPADRAQAEHEADALGLTNAAVALHAMDTDPVNALFGAHLFLRAVIIAWRALAILRGTDPEAADPGSGTHPPNRQRITVLQAGAEFVFGAERAADACDLCAKVDPVLDDFQALTEAQMTMLRGLGAKPHAVWGG